MIVTFKNIGAIKEAKIDLSKKLTIFCGPNNTGKTYLAYCIYALNKIIFSHIYSDFIIKDLQELYSKSKTSVNIFEIYKEYKNEIKEIIKKYFVNELPRTFGLDKILIEKIFPNSSIDLEFDDDITVEDLIVNSLINGKIGYGNDITVDFNKSNQSQNVDIIITSKDSQFDNDFKIFLNSVISSYIIEIIIKSFLHSSYIAPVERNSIFTFSRELSLKRNILVDEMLEMKSEKLKDPYDLLERRATRYPMPVRDGLEISEDLVNYKKRDSEYAFFANTIEETVLDGKVQISKDGEVVFLPNKAKNAKLPIHLSGSIVKSLSSLIIYFRHLAQKGDLIIFDEPELNLHPDAQIIVTRIIAKIMNHGFKVLVNTHSDYIIRELNNLIMLSKLENELESLTQEYGYTKDNMINHKDVGAYLFNFNNKTKVSVKNLPVSEDGFEVESIDKVINDLNSRSQNLYFRLKGM
ncbi:MAG: hypothetical protein HW421_694 [Ignavibacteria bacterium]|nr:hypothetical protein [Ignavibacteria bacterium]